MEISYNSTQLEQEFAGISNELQNANNVLTEMVKEIENLVNNGLLKASESGPLTNSIKLKANKMINIFFMISQFLMILNDCNDPEVGTGGVPVAAVGAVRAAVARGGVPARDAKGLNFIGPCLVVAANALLAGKPIT